MGCDTRPSSEACNCCGDGELRDLISTLTNRISELETRIKEQELRDFSPPVYNDCSGFVIATNARLATCRDLRTAIDAIPNVDLSGYVTRSELDGLLARISALESEIRRLIGLVSNLSSISNNPGRDNNFGGRVDSATIEQIQQQLEDAKRRAQEAENRMRDMQNSIDDINDRQNDPNTGSGAECNFEGWSVMFRSSREGHGTDSLRITKYYGTVAGPANKMFTLDFNGATSTYQRVGNTGPQGQYYFEFTKNEEDMLTERLSSAQVIHCGRQVATRQVNRT